MELTIFIVVMSLRVLQSFSREWRSAHRRGSGELSGKVVDANQHNLPRIHGVYPAAQVENGIAPEHIIASHVTDGHVDRTRPICPYPKIAHWNRRGSSDDARNFNCMATENRTKRHVTRPWPIARFTRDNAETNPLGFEARFTGSP